MAKAMKWHVDDTTFVELDPADGEILIKQGSDIIRLTPTGTSAEELIDALLAAVIEAGWDMPDLSWHGYERDEG